MTHRRRVAGAIVAVLFLAATAAPAASDDGFAAFWKGFAAALIRNDVEALSGMIQLGPGLGDPPPASVGAFEKQTLTARMRACLARQKPVRDVDGNGAPNYAAFCGHIDFVFYRTKAGWRLTDVGPDD